MKSFNFIQRLLTLAALGSALAGAPAFAQMPGGASSSMNSAMIKLFGNNTSFTSKAELRVLDKSQKETTSLPLVFNMLDGKVRMEMDMNLVKSSEIPTAVLTTAKQLGMDKPTIIIRPDKKSYLIIYPSLQSYADVPMSAEEAAEAAKIYKIDKTKLGKETIDGHACEKSKVVISDDKGKKQDAIVWDAADLKDFPVQMQLTDDDNHILIKFKDVKLVKTEARLFEAPAGMTKFDSALKLSQDAMMKKMGGGK